VADSTLKFKVLADTGSAVSGFARLAHSMLPIKKSAEQTNTALDKIGRHKPKIDLNDQAIKRAETELKHLRDQLAKDLSADINADTSQAQKQIRKLEATIRTLSRAKSKITPQVDPTKATGAIAKIGAALRGLGSKVGGAFKSGGALSQEGPIGGFFNFLSNVAGGLGPIVSGIASGLVGIGKAAVTGATGMLQLADSADQSRNTFKLFLGGFAAADKELNSLTKLAASTPFELPELKNAGLRLLGVGMTAKQTNKALVVLGDTASAVGTDIEGVATIWAQMMSAGKVNAEDMNQLVDRNIPAWTELSKAMGKSVPELKKLSSEGKLGKDALEALYDQMGKDYAGQMDVQSGTLSGMISTLKDTWAGIQRDIGNAFLPLAKSLIPGLTSGLEGIGNKIVGNLPAIIDGVAAGMQTLITMPGVILRGLATVSQGFAGMISGIQTSMASLVMGIADALSSLPAIFGDIDTSGLEAAALGMAQASIKTNKLGKTAFDGLTAAAKEADAAVAPMAAKIEEARKAGQTAIVIQLETKEVDGKIAAADAKIKEFTTNKNNAKLDADKTYWDKKIKAAEAEKNKLVKEKANIPIDAKIDKFSGKLATAHNKLVDLGKKKSTPEVRADIAKFTKQKNKAIHELAVLDVKKANPKLDANSAAFKRKVAEAERKRKAVDKSKATVKINADDNASSKISDVDQKRKNLDGKSATIKLITQYETRGRKAAGGGSLSNSGPGNQSVAPVVNVAGPQITLHLRDERLADLIDIRVDGRAARAAHVVGRRRAVLL
jgi:tape measure domain-containing protein